MSLNAPQQSDSPDELTGPLTGTETGPAMVARALKSIAGAYGDQVSAEVASQIQPSDTLDEVYGHITAACTIVFKSHFESMRILEEREIGSTIDSAETIAVATIKGSQAADHAKIKSMIAL